MRIWPQSKRIHKFLISPAPLGVILVLLSAIFEAIGDVLPKYFVGDLEFSSVDPIVLAVLVYAINACFFTLVQRKNQRFSIPKTPHPQKKRKSIQMLATIGILDCLSTIFFFWGLQMTSAINSSILGNTEIFFGVMLSVLILREIICRKEILPILIILAGTVIIPFVVSDNEENSNVLDPEFLFGSISIIISSIIMAFGVILYQKASVDFSSRKIIQASSFFGFFSMLAIAIFFGVTFSDFNLEIQDIVIVMFLAILGFGMPVLFFVGGLKRLGSIKTVVIFSSTTVFAILFSNLFLSEQIVFANIISVCLIIVGSVLLRKKLAN